MGGISRRQFIGRSSGAAAAGIVLGTTAFVQAIDVPEAAAATSRTGRRAQAYNRRVNAAKYWRSLRLPAQPINGDETLYGDRIACFTKTMPHHSDGRVDNASYDAYLAALTSGKAADFEAIPAGGTARLANPMGSYAFTMQGNDTQAFAMPAPPAFASAEMAAELTELYWAQLLRDVPFARYESDSAAIDAADEMSAMSGYAGTSPSNLFRGTTPGDLTGPFISQFLYKDVPYGATPFSQKGRFYAAGIDFMTEFGECLRVQQGLAPTGTAQLEPDARYIRTGRDLATWVHRDFPYQGGMNAALILLSMGPSVLAPTNPYLSLGRQGNFVTFGAPMILDVLGTVSQLALQAAWHQKWLLHRRIRPEAYAARVETTVNGMLPCPLHHSVLDSDGLARVQSLQSSADLGQVYPEGSPTHPAYPAGHAVLSGAFATVLKAFFDENAEIPNPVQPSEDGGSLVAYGGTLSVGGELNKLAANIARGRDIAGVHYRSDGFDGMDLGEAVAISVLRDLKRTLAESFGGFSFTRFNGKSITI